MRDPSYPDVDEPSPLAGKLEIETSGIGSADAALYSIAISLKRLADVAEGKGDGGLNAYFFEQAAYQAGIAFERGRR